jgi:hypothetical protein
MAVPMAMNFATWRDPRHTSCSTWMRTSTTPSAPSSCACLRIRSMASPRACRSALLSAMTSLVDTIQSNWLPAS